MEIIIILLVLIGFAYVIFKVAISKIRDSAGWILAGVILSPIIIIIFLALMPSLPGKKKLSIKRKK